MKRRNYSPEFKRETVNYINEHEVSIREASKKFGVGSTALRRWRVEYQDDAEQAFPGQGNLRAESKRIKELEEENKRLRQEREILKKATAFFAKEVK